MTILHNDVGHKDNATCFINDAGFFVGIDVANFWTICDRFFGIFGRFPV